VEKKKILQRLKQSGQRLTSVRSGLLDLFLQPHTPLAAQEILTLLKKTHSELNKTTIYRQLGLLTTAGILEVVDFQEGQKRYELAQGESHHHHLVCTVCKSVEHISLHSLEKILTRLEQDFHTKKKFQVETHALEFFGRCASCQSLL